MTSKQIKFVEDLEEQKDIHRMTLLKIASEQTNRRIAQLRELDNKEGSELIKYLLEL